MSDAANESPEAAVHAFIARTIAEHPVVLFMKGVPDQPRCGFSSLVVQVFDVAHPIAVGVSAEPDFVLWHTAPVFPGPGVAVLGELAKWVPVSEARVVTIIEDATAVSVLIAGEPGERVPFSFWSAASSIVVTVPCVIGDDGRAVASSAGTCASGVVSAAAAALQL